MLTVIDRYSGELLRQLPTLQERTAINAVAPSGDVLLLRSIDSSVQVAIERSTGRQLWRCEGNGLHAIGIGDVFVLASADGTSVSARSARAGDVEWTCALSQVEVGAHLRSGGRVLTAVDDGHVLARLANDRLVRISVTGRIVAVGAAGRRGECLVTPEHYISGGPEGVSVLDHRTMETVEEHEWENDVRTAFGGGLPEAYGLQVSDTSVVWISGEGVVAGVRRPGARGGRRKVWRDHIENAMFTVSHPIAASGSYVYISPIWTPGTEPPPPGVCCYASPDESDVVTWA